MNFFKNLAPSLLTAIIVLAVSLVGFASTSFLLTTQYLDVPLGMVFSGGIIAFLYASSYFMIRKDEKDQTHIWSIVSVATRLAVELGVLLVMVLMYYKWNIKLFNVFTFVGVYTVGVIVFSITSARKRKE